MPRRTRSTTAADALLLLQEQEDARQEELEQYDDAPPLTDEDDEMESDYPELDRFFKERGNNAVMKMTNFTLNEFEGVWNQLRDHILANYNSGRGSKSKIKAKDLLFMTMATLKHGSNWDAMALCFNMNSTTFEKRVSDMIVLLSNFAYHRFVESYAERYTMERFIADKTVFKNYKMCRYATDVTFEQAYRPTGSLQEVKKYYLGKHKLYGFKVEVSVLPNGLAMSSSTHYAGSVADIEIMREMLSFHEEALEKKSDAEKAITDIGPDSSRFPDSWAVLLDKGYLEMDNEIRSVIPKKKPKGGMLCLADRRENEAKSSDRIIVGNFFGRQGQLWTVVSNKYLWAERSYTRNFRLTVALTNVHIKWHPWRDEDGRTYERYLKRLRDIMDTDIKKRQRAQASYRKKRSRMLEPVCRAEGGAAMSDEDE